MCLFVLLIFPLNAQRNERVKKKVRMNKIQQHLQQQEASIHSIMSEIHWLHHEISDFRSLVHSHSNSSVVNQTHGCSCDEMIARIEATEQKFDSKFDDMTSQLVTLESSVVDRLDELNSQLAVTENRLDSDHEKIRSRINATEYVLHLELSNHETQFNTMKYKLESGIEALSKQIIQAEQMLGHRIKELETDVAEQAIQESVRPENEPSVSDDVLSRIDQLASRIDEMSRRVDDVANSTGPEATAAPSPPRDCSDLPAHAPSGVYNLALGIPGISHPTPPLVAAYCDLRNDGGRWTVIQRRADIRPPVKFNRRWKYYKAGFGQLHGEFWWGLENMFQVTGPRDRQYELLVNLVDSDGTRRHALYGQFRVDDEANGYKLTVTNYTGDAGDSLRYHSGCKFSAFNKDQDMDKKRHCAKKMQAGWWYRSCQTANLNGRYSYNKRTKNKSIFWNRWPSKTYSFKEVEMKIRPVITTSI